MRLSGTWNDRLLDSRMFSPLPLVSSFAGMRFIAGEPMKPATKRVLG